MLDRHRLALSHAGDEVQPAGRWLDACLEELLFHVRLGKSLIECFAQTGGDGGRRSGCRSDGEVDVLHETRQMPRDGRCVRQQGGTLTLVTPITRSSPFRALEIRAAFAASKKTLCTPPSRACSAGAPPRYLMVLSLMPVH